MPELCQRAPWESHNSTGNMFSRLMKLRLNCLGMTRSTMYGVKRTPCTNMKTSPEQWFMAEGASRSAASTLRLEQAVTIEGEIRDPPGQCQVKCFFMNQNSTWMMCRFNLQHEALATPATRPVIKSNDSLIYSQKKANYYKKGSFTNSDILCCT